jgi:hypothetical protein
MKILRSMMCCALAAFAPWLSLHAAEIMPGDIDPNFGDNGWVRLRIDRGDTPFDSARHVKVRSERGQDGDRPFLYVAGIAGDRVAIAKYTLNGKPLRAFGDNGIVFSTRQRIGSLAGLELMDNGDVVIAYSDQRSDEATVWDFFVEVFDADGRPRPIQTLYSGGWPLPPEEVNWRGADLICDGTLRYMDEAALFLYPETIKFHGIAAYSLARGPTGNLVVTGNATLESVYGSFEDFDYVMGSIEFDFAGGKYERNRERGLTCHEYDNEDDDTPTLTPSGAHIFVSGIIPGLNYGDNYGMRVTDSVFMRDQLWLSGYDTQIIFDPQPPYIFPWRFRDLGVAMHAGTTSTDYCGGGYGCDDFLLTGAGLGEYIQGSYWDARQSYLKSVAVEDERLYFYGDAETAFYPGGNYHTPIISERLHADSTVLQPRLLPLNSELGNASALVEKGLRVDDQHLLLGALNDCHEANNCGGKQDRFFVAISASAPINGLYYGEDPRFGSQGSQAYAVPDDRGDRAQRVWAFDGAVVERGVDNAARSLIVVGDFLPGDSNDPINYDWFIAKIRLPGKAGQLTLGVSGAGDNTGFPAHVEIAPTGVLCRRDCQYAYPGETLLTLRAVDSASFIFAGWEPGSACSNLAAPTCEVRIDGDVTAKARFAPRF